MKNAEMTMLEPVRPPAGFEAIYQGQANSVPIAFPGTLDPLAGTKGYSPDLLAGISTPLGSRVFVQIPMIVDQYASVPGYFYQFLWRSRNQQGFNAQMQQGLKVSQYHLKGEEPGRREKQSLGQAADLFFMPGASDVEIFEQSEPGGVNPATLNIRQQYYVPVMGQSWVQPFTPSGASGIWQQGVYQYSSNVNCSGPTFFPLWLDAQGDELLILLFKQAGEDPWDFAGNDLGVSNTYGSNNGGLPNNPNIGILISTGSMGGG